MDEDEGELIRTLQRPELAEERGHLTGRVLVDPVQAHERIEQEEPRAIAVEGGSMPMNSSTPSTTPGRPRHIVSSSPRMTAPQRPLLFELYYDHLMILAFEIRDLVV